MISTKRNAWFREFLLDKPQQRGSLELKIQSKFRNAQRSRWRQLIRVGRIAAAGKGAKISTISFRYWFWIFSREHSRLQAARTKAELRTRYLSSLSNFVDGDAAAWSFSGAPS